MIEQLSRIKELLIRSSIGQDAQGEMVMPHTDVALLMLLDLLIDTAQKELK